MEVMRDTFKFFMKTLKGYCNLIEDKKNKTSFVEKLEYDTKNQRRGVFFYGETVSSSVINKI